MKNLQWRRLPPAARTVSAGSAQAFVLSAACRVAAAPVPPVSPVPRLPETKSRRGYNAVDAACRLKRLTIYFRETAFAAHGAANKHSAKEIASRCDGGSQIRRGVSGRLIAASDTRVMLRSASVVVAII